MYTDESAAATGRSPLFSEIPGTLRPELLHLVFDQDYRCGQEIGVSFGEEVFLYEVAQSDIGADIRQTQANVARGVLAALVNGGFQSFPRSGATLINNTLTVLHLRGHGDDSLSELCRDVAWAQSLWSN